MLQCFIFSLSSMTCFISSASLSFSLTICPLLLIGMIFLNQHHLKMGFKSEWSEVFDDLKLYPFEYC